MSITGVGAVTGYGWGTKHLWDGFLLGESAVTLTGGLEGYVEGGEAYLSLITDEGDRRDGPSRFMQAARHAGREAVSDAIERGWKPGPVVGLVHSIEAGDIESWSEFYRSGESKVRPKRWVNLLPSTVISQFMKEHDFHGPSMSVSAMCATANTAMITAKSWLDSGVATDVILLATDLSGIPQTLRGSATSGWRSSTVHRSRPAAPSKRAAAVSSAARRPWPWCCRGTRRVPTPPSSGAA